MTMQNWIQLVIGIIIMVGITIIPYVITARQTNKYRRERVDRMDAACGRAIARLRDLETRITQYREEGETGEK